MRTEVEQSPSGVVNIPNTSIVSPQLDHADLGLETRLCVIDRADPALAARDRPEYPDAQTILAAQHPIVVDETLRAVSLAAEVDRRF